MVSRPQRRTLTWMMFLILWGLVFVPPVAPAKDGMSSVNENLMFTGYVSYNYTEVETFEYTGREGELTLTWVVPPNTSRQTCKVLSVQPSPDVWYYDEWGNLLCNITVATPHGSTFAVSGIYNVTSFSTGKDAVHPSRVGGVNQIPTSLYQKYSTPSYWWNYTHPKVKSIIDEVNATTEQSMNVYHLVVQAKNYVVEHLTYEQHKERHGATWAATNGRGDCEEYTDLFIAILRGLGIPARRMSGFHVESVGNHTEQRGHAWPEIWFPGYGWIPYEVTTKKDGPPPGQISSHYIAYTIEGWAPPPSANVSEATVILGWDVSIKPFHYPSNIRVPWHHIIISVIIILIIAVTIKIAKKKATEKPG